MWLNCPECRDESPFEQPPCLDGHGGDCPEWACVSCGYAVFAGEQIELLLPVNPSPQRVTRPVTGRRSQQSHAA
jgi:hypothetical protein